MKTSNSPRAFRAALIAVALGGASTAALADIKDYTFELVDQSVQAGPDKIITVRLMNTKTGKLRAGCRYFCNPSRHGS